MTDWNLLENQLSQLGPYVLCQEISVQPIVFEHILIPKDLPQTFLKNTTNEFRFAYLYGKLVIHLNFYTCALYLQILFNFTISSGEE